jgi:hypothetical protein
MPRAENDKEGEEPKGSGRTFGELNQKEHEIFSFRFRHSQGTA